MFLKYAKSSLFNQRIFINSANFFFSFGLLNSESPICNYFKELRLSPNKFFVDKTLFIKEIIKSEETYIIMRPPKWGKTLNMEMLKRFLEIEVDAGGNFNLEDDNCNNKFLLGGKIMIKKKNINKEINLSALKIVDDKEFFYQHQGQNPIIFITFDSFTVYEKIQKDL